MILRHRLHCVIMRRPANCINNNSAWSAAAAAPNGSYDHEGIAEGEEGLGGGSGDNPPRPPLLSRLHDGGGSHWEHGHCETEKVVLNEVVIDRGSASYLANVEAFCDGHFVTRVQVRTVQGEGREGAGVW